MLLKISGRGRVSILKNNLHNVRITRILYVIFVIEDGNKLENTFLDHNALILKNKYLILRIFIFFFKKFFEILKKGHFVGHFKMSIFDFLKIDLKKNNFLTFELLSYLVTIKRS